MDVHHVQHVHPIPMIPNLQKPLSVQIQRANLCCPWGWNAAYVGGSPNNTAEGLKLSPPKREPSLVSREFNNEHPQARSSWKPWLRNLRKDFFFRYQHWKYWGMVQASLKLVYEVHVRHFLPTHEDQHFGQLRMLFDQLIQHRLVLHQQPSVGL